MGSQRVGHDWATELTDAVRQGPNTIWLVSVKEGEVWMHKELLGNLYTERKDHVSDSEKVAIRKPRTVSEENKSANSLILEF